MMATTKKGKTTIRKKETPSLVFEGGQYYIVKGKSKLDVGRNRRYAERLFAESQ